MILARAKLQMCNGSERASAGTVGHRLSLAGKERVAMPSIPQSLLWISLVVLWLFVLVPMLVSKRDAVRRTSDVALATRVLNSATAARLIKRGGPAAGHRSDPGWQPEGNDHDNVGAGDDQSEEDASSSRVATVSAASVEETAPDHVDFGAVAPDSEVLPVSASAEVDEETVEDTH